MLWFCIALLGPLCTACASHTDKYLISRYLRDGSAGALVIFSALFSIVSLPIIVLVHPDVFSLPWFDALFLGLNDMLLLLALLCYFYALQYDDVSVVVPLYQTIPLFGLVLGYSILGETVYISQMIAALGIIVGALILSTDTSNGHVRTNTRVIALMLLASLLYATNAVLFKLVAVDDGFWPSVFWGFVGKGVFGLVLLVCVRSYRSQFITLARHNSRAVLGFNALAEMLYICGEAATSYAILLAPVALVLLVNAFQPVFVLFIGIILSVLVPHISHEPTDRATLIRRISGIALLMCGAITLIGTVYCELQNPPTPLFSSHV